MRTIARKIEGTQSEINTQPVRTVFIIASRAKARKAGASVLKKYFSVFQQLGDR